MLSAFRVAMRRVGLSLSDMTAQANQSHVTPETLARFAGVVPRTICRAIAAGEIEAFRLRPRGPWKIRRAEAARVLAKMGLSLPEAAS